MAPVTASDAAARPAMRQVERTIGRDFSMAIESQAWVETRGVAEREQLGLDAMINVC